MSTAQAQFQLNLESGALLCTRYNDAGIPSGGGTLFDLSAERTAQSKVFYRIRANYTLSDQHTFSALYAPLTVGYEGNFGQAVNFNGVGLTAMIPGAHIRLKSEPSGRNTNFDNVSFVPLINFT